MGTSTTWKLEMLDYNQETSIDYQTINHNNDPQQLVEEGRVPVDSKLPLESLGLMAGGIAHDFNNILTGILCHAQLAQLDVIPESDAYESINAVIIGTRRAMELTKQILAFTGNIRPTLQPISLSDLVRETVHLLRLSVSDHVIFLDMLTHPLPSIIGSPAQIQQVILNLITNAVDAIGQHGGSIVLRTSLETLTTLPSNPRAHGTELRLGRYVCFEVTDNGCGMDHETLTQIFEPFFTTKPGGRGIGLASVLRIVNSHKATLLVESQPDIGTSFRILFPVA